MSLINQRIELAAVCTSITSIQPHSARLPIQEENDSKDGDTSNSGPIIPTNLEKCGNLHGREKGE